jgi:hypothetical protein
VSRLRVIAPLLAAALLTAVAVTVAERAGCDEPGHYELDPNGPGYVLVGGCIAPGDIVVPAPQPAPHPVPGDGAPSKS